MISLSNALANDEIYAADGLKRLVNSSVENRRRRRIGVEEANAVPDMHLSNGRRKKGNRLRRRKARGNRVATSKNVKLARPSFVVGLGASAGGLEALGSFFDAMPADSGMAFVVIQHLSPAHKSMMAELLARHTRMPVRQAEDGAAAKPNHVYLIPPKKRLTIFKGKLLLTEWDSKNGPNLPIDAFFSSL